MKFRGGIHPPDGKELTRDRPITPVKSPSRVTVPLLQHIGAPAVAAVRAGDGVTKGQIIGTAGGFVSAPVHSPVSGRVGAVSTVSLPSGAAAPAVIIENDGQETWTALQGSPDTASVTPEQIRERILAAGIVGMGGAAFPTHVKLSPPRGRTVDALIINGVECEPYLNADFRLMLENSGEIIEGTKLIMKALGVARAYIGIEANKPEAAGKMKTAAGSDPSLSVHLLKVKYPQGAEKMLIKAILNREVPPRGLPMDVGVVVQNVATAKAAYEAVRFGRPLIERVVTVTGDGVARPDNVLAPLGMSVADLIEACGGFKREPGKVVMGGPMMGVALASLDVPVTKGTSGIIVMSKESARQGEEYGPCIRCGRCIDACPMGLIPSMLGILAEKSLYEQTREYHVHDCFECGSCTYVCPAKRPMVQFIKLSKSLVKP